MEELEDCGLAEAYRLVLALARSARQLELLHNQFDADQRLLREDFVTLREYWQEVLGNRKFRGDPSTTESFEALVSPLRKEKTLSTYYASKLDTARADIDTQSHDVHPREIVVSSIHSRSRFAVYYCGARFDVRCTFLGYQLMIEFSIGSNVLTEELTHRLRSCWPLMAGGINIDRRAKWQHGHEVNFIFVTSDERHLKSLLEAHQNGARFLVARQDFCLALAVTLESFNLPKSRICRLMPPSDSTPPGAVSFIDRSGLTWVECYD